MYHDRRLIAPAKGMGRSRQPLRTAPGWGPIHLCVVAGNFNGR
jgi:hypothetical protein